MTLALSRREFLKVSTALSGGLAPTATLVADLAESTTPPAYGASFALYNVAYTVGLLVGPAGAGAVAQRAGVPVAERCLAAALLVLGLWLLWHRRGKLRALPAASP